MVKTSTEDSLRKKTAIDILEALLPTFYESVRTGFNDYYRANDGQTHKHRATTRANIIYDNILYELKVKLLNDQSISFIRRNGLTLLKVCDKYLIKIKKLDENHKSSNVATRQNDLFINQGVLFDLGDSLENLEIGYVFNKGDSDISGIFMVCPKDDKTNEWELDLDEYFRNRASATLFSQDDVESQDNQQRFKVKKKHDNNDGTIREEKRS